ncbi:MAG: Crp/Fnr family transcriptional regulator [Vallitaleaceae bacterium]|nr:Crp/Fnr family transcriptional regulator [Vallitaleaceae bacterium]
MKKVGKLQETHLFSQLSESVVVQYFSHCRTHKFRKKEEIFRSEQHLDYIYIVLQGRIRVYLRYPNGKEFTLTILEPGAAYSVHTRAFGQALADGEIAFIPVQSFRKLLMEVPLFAMSVISVLGDSLKNSINTIESLVFKEVNKRLYQFVYSLALASGEQGKATYQVNLGLTHQQIATIVGSTRQTVNAFFNNLQKEGLIRLEKDKIIIQDFNEIAKRAQDDAE